MKKIHLLICTALLLGVLLPISANANNLDISVTTPDDLQVSKFEFYIYDVDKKCYLVAEKLEEQYSIVNVTNDTVKATSFVPDKNGILSIIGIPKGQYLIKYNPNQDSIGYVSIENTGGFFQIEDSDFSLTFEIVKDMPEEEPTIIDTIFRIVGGILYLIASGIIIISIGAVIIYIIFWIYEEIELR